MPASTKLTIRKLAALAGVSRSTASLAMQNHPRISEKTRQHVRRLAEEHGYRPDPVVSSLMNQLRIARTRRNVEKLAFLHSWDNLELWEKSFTSRRWFEGARARAEALGYDIENIWAREPGMTASRLSKVLHTRSIRGVIIAPLLRPRGHLSLNWQHLAAATIGQTVVKPSLHRASHSHYNGMILAARQLRKLGCRRIGFANLTDQVERVRHGWLAAYHIFSLGQPAKDRIPPFLDEAWDRKRFVRWLEKYRPDAVISNNDDPLRFLREEGYRIPQDLAYANLDASFSRNDWAGVDQCHDRIGATAVDLVVGQLQRNEFGLPAVPLTVNLDGVWREGSTACRRG